MSTPVTVTFVQPQTGQMTGPGFIIVTTSDFSGPLVNPVWRYQLTDSDDVFTAVDVSTVPLPGTGHQGFAIAYPAWGSDPVRVRSSLLEHLGSARLHAELAGTGGVVDSGVITVIADLVSGALYNIARRMSDTNAGLTEDEHLAVMAAAANTSITWPTIAGDIISTIADIIRHPPLAVGQLTDPCYVLTGDGSVPGLHDPAQFTWGLHWIADPIPAGLGHTHGNTEEYQNRLVQFRTVHVVGGVEVVTEVADFNWHGGLWRWSEALPSRVDYSILPGVTLCVRWWRAP